MSNQDKFFSLTVLGTRGSLPVTGKDKTEYGCATSSYLVETDKEAIVLDAGNGVMNLKNPGEKRLSLLITHSHIDHVLGLPAFLSAAAGREVTIYGATRKEGTIKEQLKIFLARPLWPVSFDVYPASVEFRDVPTSFNIGEVVVTTMESNHPGGSTIFALEYDGRKIVYATDFEHEGNGSDAFNELIAFSAGADMVLYDAQYTASEYERCRGFGHSTYEKALELYDASGAKNMLLIHHAPEHTDAFMKGMEKELAAAIRNLKNPLRGDIHFAKECETIKID